MLRVEKGTRSNSYQIFGVQCRQGLKATLPQLQCGQSRNMGFHAKLELLEEIQTVKLIVDSSRSSSHHENFVEGARLGDHAGY